MTDPRSKVEPEGNARTLQQQLDDALFELQEYRRAARYKVKLLMVEMDGMPNQSAIVIDATEPLLVQPGMELLVVLPPKGKP